jgi:hypothetical protein
MQMDRKTDRQRDEYDEATSGFSQFCKLTQKTDFGDSIYLSLKSSENQVQFQNNHRSIFSIIFVYNY